MSDLWHTNSTNVSGDAGSQPREPLCMQAFPKPNES